MGRARRAFSLRRTPHIPDHTDRPRPTRGPPKNLDRDVINTLRRTVARTRHMDERKMVTFGTLLQNLYYKEEVNSDDVRHVLNTNHRFATEWRGSSNARTLWVGIRPEAERAHLRKAFCKRLWHR